MSSLAAFAPSLAALRPKAAKTSKVSKAVVAERRTETVVPAISTRRALLGGAVSAAMTLAMSPGPAAAKDGKNGVYWIEPKDGATVAREFNVKMGVIGYELAPASEGLQEGPATTTSSWTRRGDTSRRESRFPSTPPTCTSVRRRRRAR